MPTEQNTTMTAENYDPARKLNGAAKTRKPEHVSLKDGAEKENTPMERAQEAYENGLEHAQEFGLTVGETIRRNPLLTLGAAFGIGVAVALLVARKN